MLSEFVTRLRALVSRRSTDADLDEEIRYHVEREIERNVANGMSAAEARDAARRAFGNVTVATEQARDAWRWTWLEETRQDCVYAARTFRRAPGFVFTVIGTIGLGLGLLSTVFTFFDSYVLRPFSVRDPFSLYAVEWTSVVGGSRGFTWEQVAELARDRSTFSDVLAYDAIEPRIARKPTQGQLVTGNYFDMLGVPPALGRTTTSADAEAGNAVMVLSHQGWLTLFHGDSSVIGRRVDVSGTLLEVVGVAREGFGGLNNTPYDFWIPMAPTSKVGPDAPASRLRAKTSVRVIARLAPGVDKARATTWMREWLRARTASDPQRERVQDVFLYSRGNAIPPDAEVLALFAPVFVAFGLVMLIACANVTNIMLARGLARQREIGIRLALGASRRRIVRQLLAESLLLAIPAGVVGLLLSRLTLWGVIGLMFATMPTEAAAFVRLIPMGVDVRIAAFALLAVGVAAIGFGLAPALQASRPNIVQVSRGDFDTQFRPSRLRNVLVVGQVTMSVVLLICAGILLTASNNISRIDPGVRTDGVVQLRLLAPFRARGLDALRTDPNVRELAAASSSLIDDCCPKITLRGGERTLATVNFLNVSDSWFSVFDVRVVRGRLFTADEARSRAPVVVISETMARRVWPGADPIGQTLAIPPTGPEYAALEPFRTARVIGVTRDAASNWIGQGGGTPVAYYPRPLDASGPLVIVVRVAADAAAGKLELERTLAAVDSAAITEMHSVDDALAMQAYPFRAMHWVTTALGLIALSLTFIGVYGVVSYLVEQRRREFGIRLALGARQLSLIGLIVGQSTRLAVFGVVIGVALTLGVSRLFASVIPSLDTYDPAGYLLGILLVLVACLVAAFGPSYRAATINPVETLRAD
jgi:predicted permease